MLSPKEYIEAHGDVPVGSVVAVWSPGESDFRGCETYLFLDEDNAPYTAVEYGDDFIIRPGWKWFDHKYAV